METSFLCGHKTTLARPRRKRGVHSIAYVCSTSRSRLPIKEDSQKRSLAAKSSECPVSADSVEKQRVATAESGPLSTTRVPFLSGLLHLQRCRQDLG